MGLLNFIKGQFIEVIDWIDDRGDTVIWKFPDKDCEIKMGATLTVRESQVAIFMNEGRMADVYQPGRYELVTRNMPIMTSLRSWKTGFNSPFKADVYFVSTREFGNQKWGTKQPIMVSDPDFSLVPLRAFGSFNFRVSDAALFFKQFAGTDPHVTTDEVNEFFRSTVVTHFSNALKRAGKTLAEINFRAQELGTELLPLLQQDFSGIGLTLTRFNVESVSLPEEIQKALTEQDLEFRQKRRTMNLDNEMEIQQLVNKAQLSQNIGDMNKFMQFQTAVGMDGKTGSTPASDMATTMMQMQMMQQMLNQQNAAQAAANPTPAPSGNMTKDQIIAAIKELGDLKAAGILTEEEFNTKKQDLLARL